MRIIKVLSKKVKETNSQYYKYLLNLPKEVVENSRLLGKNLKAKTERGKIIVEKKNS